MEKIKCEFCGKEYSKKGIGSHIWRSHGNGKNHDPNVGYKNGERVVWNKGLTKATNDSVKKCAETYKKRIKSGEIKPSFLGKKHTPETILKLKKTAGGIRNGAGRGKSGWYKNYWCDSTWELAYVIYNLDHNINFKRNTKGFEYIYNGNIKKYYPDFILDDGTFVEIKGCLDDINKEKIKQFKFPLKILLAKEILQYIMYVKTKYMINEIYLLYETKVA